MMEVCLRHGGPWRGVREALYCTVEGDAGVTWCCEMTSCIYRRGDFEFQIWFMLLSGNCRFQWSCVARAMVGSGVCLSIVHNCLYSFIVTF